MLRYCLVVFIGHHPEPDTSGLEKTATSSELEFSSRSNKKNYSKLLMFSQLYLEKNSSSPEGVVFLDQMYWALTGWTFLAGLS